MNNINKRVTIIDDGPPHLITHPWAGGPANFLGRGCLNGSGDAEPSEGSDYAEHYHAILDFQLGFAKLAIPHDDVVILTDDHAFSYFAKHLPARMLLRCPMADIWTRDFGT